MTRFAIQRVRGTAAALELIESLAGKHGPVALHSEGCDSGCPARCLTKAELLPGEGDIKLGEIGGAPFYVDRDEYMRCGRPALVIDVEPAGPRPFTLEGLEGLQFVVRARGAVSDEDGESARVDFPVASR